MSKFNEELMYDYADKLLIGLTLEEAKTLVDEFDVIESRMDLINEIEGISEVEPMHYPFIIEPNISIALLPACFTSPFSNASKFGFQSANPTCEKKNSNIINNKILTIIFLVFLPISFYLFLFNY